MSELLTRYFSDPLFLLVSLAAVPLYLLLAQSAGRVIYSSIGLVPRRARSWRATWSWIPQGLLALAMVAFSVALAGPRLPDAPRRIEREGIAIMMVLDRSSSMSALDLSDGSTEQTRLDVVKDVFKDFVLGEGGLDGRPDDAIGLISFARYADSSCPLTLEHGNLLDIAADVELAKGPNEDGTALGDALGLAVERLQKIKVESKIIILLTDGVQTAGDDSPADAARVAARYGVKVYTIGAGTKGFAPVRVEDPRTGRSVLRQMPVQIDETTLAEVAELTGGRYFRATDGRALRDVYDAIDGLEKTRIEAEHVEKYLPLFEIPTAAAALLACLGWILGASVFRRDP